MMGCKPVDTPMDANVKLDMKENDEPVDKGQSQRLVGKLIYLAHTLPDIAFVVSCVSQFMHSPSKSHLDVVYRILKYLKGTPGRGLLFQKNEERKVEVYVHADWAGLVTDRRSTSGYWQLGYLAEQETNSSGMEQRRSRTEIHCSRHL